MARTRDLVNGPSADGLPIGKILPLALGFCCSYLYTKDSHIESETRFVLPPTPLIVILDWLYVQVT